MPTSPPCGSSLKQKEIDKANHLVKKAIEKDLFTKRGKYATYTATERAKIGKYAAENGNTKACGYFFKAWKREIPESTVRRLKNEYLKELNEKRMAGYDEKECTVTCLPTQSRGRPLLVGVELDVAIQDYIRTLRQAGGVVNTAIVMAAAEGIISSRCPGKLQKQGGDIQIGKDWAKSLMSRMGFVKRKVSNAGKILSSAIFLELREQFLADIAAEVIMNDIHPDLIINWDQTGLKFVPTGDWTMNLSGDKVVSIVGSDDKREITAVLAVTITGRCLPPQLLYKGTTSKCHPIIEFPERWDIWHSHNHWSNEETMKRYLDKILLMFLSTNQ